MDYQGFAGRILEYVDNRSTGDEPVQTDIAGLAVLRSRQPTRLEGMLYRPVICLVLQGNKETHVGDRSVSFGPGESLIVSHTLPVMAQITQATPDLPYIAMVLDIDMNIIRSLYSEIGAAEITPEPPVSLETDLTDAKLIGAMERLFALVDHPDDAKVLVPLLLREIHFLMLKARHGGMLRQLLHTNSHASQIANAIQIIRQNYNEPLAVPELASSAGMSTSSFHAHFKAITATTPLQYQKDLRLIEARHLLQEKAQTVTAAAFQVGYESATQFSREYARKFGVPPRQDSNGIAGRQLLPDPWPESRLSQ